MQHHLSLRLCKNLIFCLTLNNILLCLYPFGSANLDSVNQLCDDQNDDTSPETMDILSIVSEVIPYSTG